MVAKNSQKFHSILLLGTIEMVADSNYTRHTKLPDSERYLWTAYNTALLLASLPGNIAILVATTKHIKLHGALQVILRHLAVNNLLFSVFGILTPELLRLAPAQGPQGDILCFIQDHVDWLYVPLAGCLTCVLLVTKLLIVRSPLAAKNWPNQYVQSVCALVWVIAVYLSVQAGPIFRNSVCNPPGLELPKVVWIEKSDFIQNVCFALIATTIVLISVLIPLKARKKTADQLQRLCRQSMAGVTLITAIYLLSSSPWFIFSVIRHASRRPAILRTVHYLRNINVIAIVTYCMLIRSFRNCLKTMLRTVFGTPSRCCRSDVDGDLECILQDC